MRCISALLCLSTLGDLDGSSPSAKMRCHAVPAPACFLRLIPGKEHALPIPSSLCESVLKKLEIEYGPPALAGSIYRWAIPNHDPLNPIVLAVDDCDDAFIKAWVFDVHRRDNHGVIEFGIRSVEEVDAVLAQIHAVVRDLVNRRRTVDASGALPGV